MTYQIRLGEFEGPLDLLLDLIESRKFSVSAVSLAKITDDYIKYLKKLREFPREEVADFLVIAATLMLIKSRSLLPGLELSREEEYDIRDLEFRLKLLARMRELSGHLKAAWLKAPLFSREPLAGRSFGFVEPTGLKTGALAQALRILIKTFPDFVKLPEKTLERVLSIEEKMVELLTRLSARLKAGFHELARSKNKLETIVGFLALLELVKQGALLVRQEERFGKIELEKVK